MDAEEAKAIKGSLELAFQISNLLETSLNRHALSILTALYDIGLNTQSLAALVKEF